MSKNENPIFEQFAWNAPDGDVTVTVENLDAMIDPNDCDKAADSYAAVAEQFKTLARYARVKSRAMQLRSKGKIEHARRLEQDCDRLYATLDIRFRW